VRIVARKTIKDFREANREAEQPLKSWFREVERADWATPHEVKLAYRNSSVIGNGRIVFNIAGNKYRLVVKFNYAYRVSYIRFIGTHVHYDAIDAENI